VVDSALLVADSVHEVAVPVAVEAEEDNPYTPPITIVYLQTNHTSVFANHTTI
jgi:hypothetical protein